ncbi:MAG: hypothetical protein M3046_11500 [Actinomycetota bacterium]|nr:hypothetical protein [Actinomycetota bacterium]
MGWRDSFFGRAVALLLGGLFFGVMGWVATHGMDALVESQTARDIGITTIWVAIVVSACIWMLAKAPIPAPSFAVIRLKSRKSPPIDLLIIQAVWGTRGNEIDVTGTVSRQVNDGQLDMSVTHDLLGDPTPGMVKSLTIRYRTGNRERTKQYGEGSRAVLP